jgi:hypothetical protein
MYISGPETDSNSGTNRTVSKEVQCDVKILFTFKALDVPFLLSHLFNRTHSEKDECTSQAQYCLFKLEQSSFLYAYFQSRLLRLLFLTLL